MKFADLDWKPLEDGGVYAEAEMNDGVKYAYIHLEPNLVGDTNKDNFLYWASWDLTLTGTTDLQSLKDAAQAVHEMNLMKWME